MYLYVTRLQITLPPEPAVKRPFGSAGLGLAPLEKGVVVTAFGPCMLQLQAMTGDFPAPPSITLVMVIAASLVS